MPLFVEELTKTIFESGQLQEGPDRYVVTGTLRDITIPATLHDSLMARLDCLGAVKEVAQTAAAIGREFDYDLLAGVSPVSIDKLRDALSQLIDAELVFRRGCSTEDKYIFKHALVQDAAYGSLLKSKRQDLHGRIADVLKSNFAERVESEPELLAHHFTEAGLSRPTIEQWKKAGLRAMDSSANAEALAHLSRALELFNGLPDAEQRQQQELSLQIPLAAVLTALKGWSATETGDAYFRARELCHQTGDTSQISPVLYGIWNCRIVGGDVEGSLDLAEELLDVAQKNKERTQLLAAHSALGQTLTMTGRFHNTPEHCAKSASLYRPEEDRSLWQVYGEDPVLMALSWRSWGLWFRGFPDQARRQNREAMEITEAGSDMVVAAWAITHSSVLHFLCGDHETARERAHAAVEFSTERNVPVFQAFGSIMKGWALVENGHPQEGVPLMESSAEAWKAMEIGMMFHTFSTFLSQGYARCGDLKQALSIVEGGFRQGADSGEHMYEAELHRLKGTFLLSASPKNSDEGEKCFQRTIELAREQGAKSFELRSAICLAELYKEQGRGDEGGNLLDPIYSWFTEGFDTADLKEARTLFDQLT